MCTLSYTPTPCAHTMQTHTVHTAHSQPAFTAHTRGAHSHCYTLHTLTICTYSLCTHCRTLTLSYTTTLAHTHNELLFLTVVHSLGPVTTAHSACQFSRLLQLLEELAGNIRNSKIKRLFLGPKTFERRGRNVQDTKNQEASTGLPRF